MTKSKRPIEILLIDDDELDIKLTKRALSKNDFLINLNAVTNGYDAWDFLNQQGAFTQAARPDIILLDLNMPIKDGREVLKEIKSDEDLRMIPVLILTTSRAEEDVIQSYKLGCNGFVTKPFQLDQYAQSLNILEEFWFNVARLPHHD